MWRPMSLVSIAIFLGILVHKSTFALFEDSITLSCPALRPCTIALASRNPVTLKCEGGPKNVHVYWQYLDVSQPHARALTLIQSGGSVSQDEDLDSQEYLKVLDLMSRVELLSGNLKLLSPRVQDTGIYTCWDGGKHLAYYKIDFQDSENIYVSHASLDHKVRPNATVDFGLERSVEVFTVWQDWQACDRCGVMGERKKLGFCYGMVARNSAGMEEPQPCGLIQSRFSQIQLNSTPELRIETCIGACTEVASTNDLIILMVNYRTYLHADALLECPISLIYKPLYWERGNRTFTHLQQLMNNASYILDKKTGGGSLFIPILNKSDEGTYKCYVDHRMVGEFHVMFPKIEDTSKPQQFTMGEYTMIGISIFFVALFVLSVFQSSQATDYTDG
ncbi:protein FAM187B [Hyla sarda]|uniref:protein FAM187B n=1 Tax=Hyla sarda TaxID=327740 RepID=UPI0024C40057|nr:protein FAM187B [Hyla sarda]